MANENEKYILSFDLGTSGPKVALYTASIDLVGSEFERVPLILLPNGGAEQNPADWWQAICTATNRLMNHCPVPPGAVNVICCTSQWSGTVAVDQGGDPLMNAIIWMDMRGAPYVRKVLRGPLNLQGYGVDKLLAWIRLTGGMPGQAGKDPIAHILYLMHELPEVYQRAYKFLEPKDYINLRLTGKYATSTDAIALHWLTDNRNLARVTYDERLIKLCGVDQGKLPDIRHAVDILGPLTPQAVAELGLSGDVQVVMGTPDIHSAALGSGAVSDFEAHCYIGTSSWLVCHVPFKKTDIFHNIASLPSAIPDRYLATNEQETAGACLAYLSNCFYGTKDGKEDGGQKQDVFQVFEGLASSVPAGSEGLIFMPWLYGERTPVDDHYVRGGFFNLSLRTTRAHMVRSVYEGVAFNTRWLLECMEKFIGRRLETINMAGGGAISNFWCQIFADVLGRTIRQVQDPIHVNTRGAAVLAAVAMGYMDFAHASQYVPIANTYRPDAGNHALYTELFGEFVQLYQRNRAAFARLNRDRPLQEKIV